MYLTYQISNSIAHIDLQFFRLVLIPGWRLSHGYVRHYNGIFLHRLLLKARVGEMIDHIDGNPLNNQLSNLRICSHDENMRNRKIHKNNKAGAKGVYRYRNKWCAQIISEGKKHYLGTHETVAQAHAAYVSASKRLHGEFSRIA